MSALNDTLQSVGTGLGYLFDGIAVPLGTLVIILAIAGGIGVMLTNIFRRV
jgi:hypothetical protein